LPVLQTPKLSQSIHHSFYPQ